MATSPSHRTVERYVMRVAGIGFRSAAELSSLQDAFDQAVAAAGGLAVHAVVTESAKARAPVFRAFAQALGVPGMGITVSDLQEMITPTQSARVQDQFGTGSLCEAAALAAAGPEAALLAARVISGDGMATAAIAVNEGTDT